MKQFVWNVYTQFRCIADQCPDSCCQGWEVDVDPVSAQYYRSLPGALGDRLRAVLVTEDDATFMRLEAGRCPMWREDGLCRLQAEMGHDALCQVCQEYPRLSMDFGDFIQLGLELSCPEAARLIFQGISVQAQEIAGGTEPEYDREIMEILQKSREEILELWETGRFSVPQALAITLLYAHRVQAAIDGGEYPVFSPEGCLQVMATCEEPGDLRALLAFYQDLEILTPAWKSRLQKPDGGNWDPLLRHLAIYLIRRYWYQAVWDYDLVCRVKFLVSACILVNALGGNTMETAQLFAKEIENDPDNRGRILDAAYTHPAFTDKNLLCLMV